ncbi:MAG: hypothetical protein Q8L64_01660, partial [bacterium]|nr:hypothetical protein [bacterium]
ELPGDFISQTAPIDKIERQYVGLIKITLNDNNVHYTIKTKITKKEKNTPEIISQNYSAKKSGEKRKTLKSHQFPWERIVVCGYGAQRASLADRSYFKYNTLDAVYTLFNYDALLQNPELVLLRKEDILNLVEI